MKTPAQRREYHRQWMRAYRAAQPIKSRRPERRRAKTPKRKAYLFAYNRTPEFREMTRRREAQPERKVYRRMIDAKPQHRRRRRLYSKQTNQSRTLRRNTKLAGRAPPKRCELCQQIRKLRFDHDHRTGKFRGWICHTCNVGLGQLGDTVQGLQKGVAYLKGELPWQSHF
jgi:hypothetical protein